MRKAKTGAGDPDQQKQSPPPATGEELRERLATFGFDAPPPTEVMLPGTGQLVQGLGVSEYLGWLSITTDALQRGALAQAVGAALGDRYPRPILTASEKAWKARCNAENVATAGSGMSPVLLPEVGRLGLRLSIEATATPVIALEDPLRAAIDLAGELFGLTGSRDVFCGAILTGFSALLERPNAASARGESASGKSYPVECALALLPTDEVMVTSGSSPRALAYQHRDLRHRTLYLADANSLLRGSTNEDPNVGANLFRILLSEGRIVYETVEKDRRGTLRTVRKEVPGPIATIACLSTGRIDWDTNTRLLGLTADASPQQTSAVLDMLASRYEAGDAPVPPLETLRRDATLSSAVAPWHAYYHWLASFGPTKVRVPFARALRHFLSAAQPRVKRDMAGLLGMVQAHALLNRPRRETDGGGRLIARIEDYEAVREMLIPAFSRSGTTDDPVAVKDLLPVLRGLAQMVRESGGKDEDWSRVPDTADQDTQTAKEWPREQVKVSGRALAKAITKVTGLPISDKTAVAQLRRAEAMELVERTDNARGNGGRQIGFYRISGPPPVTEATVVNVLPLGEAVLDQQQKLDQVGPDATDDLPW